MTSPTRPQAEARSAYKAFRDIGTRWSDNDVYGHVNNVVYYSWFDTAVNGLLIERGAIDIHTGSVIGLVIETQCNYFAPLAFPEPVVAGIRVAHVGSSSVRYEVALFPGDENQPCAARGHFIHVYVDRATRRPAPLATRTAFRTGDPPMTQAPPVLPYIAPRHEGDARNAVDEAILSRQSIRQFLPTPVPRETIAHLLEVASRAPSGTNTQPWKAYVLQGASRDTLVDKVCRPMTRCTPTRPWRPSTKRNTTTTPKSGSRPTSTGAAPTAGAFTACWASPRATRTGCMRSITATSSFSTRPWA
jgi:acyl-CoA thioester hydrolase